LDDIVYNGPDITLVLVWRKSIHFWRRCARFTFSFPVTLTFDLQTWNLLHWFLLSGAMFPQNLKFLRLSNFRKSEARDGRTDRRTTD